MSNGVASFGTLLLRVIVKMADALGFWTPGSIAFEGKRGESSGAGGHHTSCLFSAHPWLLCDSCEHGLNG